jgi:hypothetical protein
MRLSARLLALFATMLSTAIAGCAAPPAVEVDDGSAALSGPPSEASSGTDDATRAKLRTLAIVRAAYTRATTLEKLPDIPTRLRSLTQDAVGIYKLEGVTELGRGRETVYLVEWASIRWPGLVAAAGSPGPFRVMGMYGLGNNDGTLYGIAAWAEPTGGDSGGANGRGPARFFVQGRLPSGADTFAELGDAP